MIYCPNCATRLDKTVDVCPYCKKVLDIKVIRELFTTKGSSRFRRSVMSKIWFKEHGHIIIPIIMIVVGLAIGTAVSFGYANVQFRSEALGFETQLAELQITIEQNKSTADDIRSEMNQQLISKEKVITILTEQKKLLGQIISFTNRLSRNSTVQPDSTSEADYYSRNVRYVISQFEKQAEELDQLGITTVKPSTLKPVPQLLE